MCYVTSKQYTGHFRIIKGLTIYYMLNPVTLLPPHGHSESQYDELFHYVACITKGISNSCALSVTNAGKKAVKWNATHNCSMGA